jgi:hypothetical protein
MDSGLGNGKGLGTHLWGYFILSDQEQQSWMISGRMTDMEEATHSSRISCLLPSSDPTNFRILQLA